jgi:hypothetical protein
MNTVGATNFISMLLGERRKRRKENGKGKKVSFFPSW